MIISRLIGGLGNQMFQYAAGRALALRHETELKLDIRDFRGYTLRQFGLSNFRITASCASPIELRNHSRWKLRLLRRLPAIQRKYYRERSFTYDPRWESVLSNVYLDGYFQSERYFLAAANLLRDEFTPIATLGPSDLAVISHMATHQSVALHVRRGDYVSDKITRGIHGVCSVGYYRQAIKLITQTVANPYFYVFSDDMDWARKNLPLRNDVIYVDWNQGSPELDLHLMSQCKHHIIANSSFSWWGAWLGSYRKQLVVAPDPWFDCTKVYSNDLVPPRWLRVSKVSQ